MSMPVFPDIEQHIPLEDALSMILTSIAMEELGLSHVINAEGEKIQYAIHEKASIEETVTVNNSVRDLIDSVARSQWVLKEKVKCIAELKGRDPGPVGPTGPPGPIGPKGEDCKPKHCCVVALKGRCGQCWKQDCALQWHASERDDCCTAYLSSDGRSVYLRGGCSFVVSFAVNVHTDEKNKHPVAVCLQTSHDGKREDRFICHASALSSCEINTLSAAGVYVPIEPGGFARLSLVLLSPEVLRVGYSSICITEI